MRSLKYISVLAAFLVLFSCTNQKKISQLEEKNVQLQTENKVLTEQAQLKDQFVEEYTNTLNEVYSNLDNIRKREGLLSKMSKGMENQEKAPIKDKMISNIASIDSYIKTSKKRLNDLKEKLYSSQLKMTSFEENIASLTKTLEEKEQFIDTLKASIDHLNTRMAEAETEIKQKNGIIAEQTDVINTAYYIIGDEKELKEKGVIEEKGGILGIRKAKKLASNLNTTEFQKADISNMENIPIDESVKKVQIISPHNPQSYQLESTGEKESVLEITNPDEFWKIKYLVILTKG